MIKLWVCFPNNSGSNFIHRYLGADPRALNSVPLQNVVSKMGLGPVSESQVWSLRPERYCLPSIYKWPQIREIMYRRWNKSPVAQNGATMIDVSQLTLAVAKSLAQTFGDSVFLFGIRNPYCFALSESSVNPLLMIKHWQRVAEFQIYNMGRASFDRPKHFIKYEDLCSDNSRLLLENFIFENTSLRSIGWAEQFRDGNARHLNLLRESPRLRRRMTRILANRKDLMDYFGYDLL